MKKTLLIISLLVVNFAMSQTMQPIPYENSGWSYVGWIIGGSGWPETEDLYECYFDGDTSINSQSYTKFYFDATRHFEPGSSTDIGSHVYIGGMRNDGDLYYFLDKDSSSEVLVYDLSRVNIGDSLPAGFYNEEVHFIIDDTSHRVMEDGSVRRSLSIDFNWIPGINPPSSFYEGIGYSNGLIPHELFELQSYNGGVDFHSFCLNGNLIYRISGITFYPALECGYTGENLELTTIRDVFDFHVGDKFHYQVSPPQVPPAIDRITITRKFYAVDTIFYERYHDSYWTEVDWIPEPHLVYHFWTKYDTVGYTDVDSLISYYDNGFQCDTNLFQCDTNIYYSDEYCGTLINGYYIASNDFEPEIYQKEYGKGLGWVWDYHYSGSSLPPGVISDMKMFYYEKNGIECGTPDTLTVSVTEIPDHQKSPLIYPNPASDYFMVTFKQTNEPLKFKIFSIYGNLVDSGVWSSETNRYNCVNLNPGVYMIQVQISSKSFNYKLIKE